VDLAATVTPKVRRDWGLHAEPAPQKRTNNGNSGTAALCH
jgi:hypothetical protein